MDVHIESEIGSQAARFVFDKQKTDSETLK
jgi:hypothetical protein